MIHNIKFSVLKYYLLLGILPFIFISCYNPNSQDVMEDLKTLEGNWKSYKGVKFNESWRLINDSLFKGLGYSMNGKDTSFFESLKIIKKGDSVFYLVGLENRKRRVDFLLTDASKRKWTFQNSENEFPSIIKYKIQNDSLLLVTIANIRGNKEQFFYLKRE